jgi:hypothetical protein
MGYPERRTVWFIKRVRETCAECGKAVRKRLVIVDPMTFRQFWSANEIIMEERVGWGGLCWKCAIND